MCRRVCWVMAVVLAVAAAAPPGDAALSFKDTMNHNHARLSALADADAPEAHKRCPGGFSCRGGDPQAAAMCCTSAQTCQGNRTWAPECAPPTAPSPPRGHNATSSEATAPPSTITSDQAVAAAATRVAPNGTKLYGRLHNQLLIGSKKLDVAKLPEKVAQAWASLPAMAKIPIYVVVVFFVGDLIHPVIGDTVMMLLGLAMWGMGTLVAFVGMMGVGGATSDIPPPMMEAFESMGPMWEGLQARGMAPRDGLAHPAWLGTGILLHLAGQAVTNSAWEDLGWHIWRVDGARPIT